jgi:isocitrate/isopropylmalate dehydrogenase
MGKDLANPIAAFFSAAEMLKWLGEDEAAAKLEAACKQSIAEGQVSRDLGGSLGTTGVTDAVRKIIQRRTT